MSIANKLMEAISCTCHNCGSVVQPDRNLTCPNCNEIIDNEILDIVWQDGSDNILIFNETDQSINKANINRLAKGHKPIGDNALVVGISKDFFDVLVPDSHDRTAANSPYGKVLPQQPDDIQAALTVLKQNATRYGESSYKNKIAKLLGESGYTDFAEEFKQYNDLWETYAHPEEPVERMWKAPDGKTVDIGSFEAKRTEVNRYRELVKDSIIDRITKSGELSDLATQSGETQDTIIENILNSYTNRVFNLLISLNTYMARQEKAITKYEAENRRIVNKLVKCTNLATMCDLEDIFNQLNQADIAKDNARTDSLIRKVNDKLIACYSGKDC